MKINENYLKWSYKHFGDIVEKYFGNIEKDLHDDLKRSGIFITAREYLSVAISTCLLVFITTVPATAVIATIIIAVTGANPLAAAITGLLTSLFLGGLLSVGTFSMFYVYPSIIIGEQQKRVKSALPFALLYMETLAGSGMPIIGVFRTMSKFEDFGEFSRESKRIVSEADVAGIDLPTTLENAASRTSSQELKEIFWGIKSIIVVGGDLKKYLHEQAASAMQDYRRYLEDFTRKLSLLVEAYITVVIVGSVFFVVLTTIIGGIGGGNVGAIVAIQMIITFIFLPITSVGFYVLAKGISPTV